MLSKDQFREELQKLVPQYESKTHLLAVSGGIDSMLMLHFFQELKLDFAVAHVNYQLRNESSDLDQQLVEKYCMEHAIPFYLYKVTEEDLTKKKSVQEWARNIRYSYFNKIVKEKQFDTIVTAHHQNDQIETFFINLSRGSGIDGLSGIPKKRDLIIRPFLSFTKGMLLDYAKENSIAYRTDESNYENYYLRNKLRNTILPELKEIVPHFIENISHSISHLAESKEFIEVQLTKILDTCIISSIDSSLVLDKKMLSTQSSFVQFSLLKRYGFTSSLEIPKILKASTGSSFFSISHQLVINRDQIIIREISTTILPDPFEEIVLVNTLEEASEKNYTLSLKNYLTEKDEFEWEFDLEKLVFPLILRKKKLGDVFYPVGMNGKKKVSKFYKDKKLSIFAKQEAWIICDQEHNLGLPPYRQDKRKAAESNSKLIFKITN